MTNIQILILVAALALAVAVVSAIVATLTRRGVDVGASLTIAQTMLTNVTDVAKKLQPFVPEDKFSLVDRIVAVATIAVGNAEQLANTAKLTDDERKPAAVQYIRDTLALAGVIWTNDIAKLADGAIEAAVLELGHKDEAEMVQVTGFALPTIPLTTPTTTGTTNNKTTVPSPQWIVPKRGDASYIT